jgi:NAD+ synthase (glutamine-hydrolysing)
MKSLRIALAQINPTVGDLKGNTEKIIHYIQEARRREAQIVAFTELAVTGYPPEDLLLKPRFIEDNLQAVETITAETAGIIAVVGFVDRKNDIYNAAAVMGEGTIFDIYHKMYLPNYGVFDEMRYFQAGTRQPVYRLGEIGFGVNICEDIWYPDGPARLQTLGGAELIININASPFDMGKAEIRQEMLATRARDFDCVVAYVNTAGGQDELVFDGGSLVFDERGNLFVRGAPFEEELIVADLDIEGVFMSRLHNPRRRQEKLAFRGAVEEITLPASIPLKTPGPLNKPHIAPALSQEEEVYKALTTGVRDYVSKNRFREVLIGLSGGVDSAVVASVAADAIGAKNVHCLFMPSRFTSEDSREDSYKLCANLGVALKEVSIERIFQAYLETLSPLFKGHPHGVTEENIQARIRGNILMAFSNKLGYLVLTTGNKSEMSVGYATLYGDMAGGFAVIKDVPKTMVYALAKWKNCCSGRQVIPERIITKAPTAELRENQKDTDTLPPYPILDPVLQSYIEEDRSFEEILGLGGEPEGIKRVIAMIDRSEYKRRQAPPGIKITPRAFGRDRRFPITNRYREF